MKNNIKISTPIENNVIMVTNNNVKYYENLANQYAKESAKSAVKKSPHQSLSTRNQKIPATALLL